jgi:tRNA (Thr-GGU) A37 N-methylase
VLDLKPYIPSIDAAPECARDGWISKRRMDRKADDRFKKK